MAGVASDAATTQAEINSITNELDSSSMDLIELTLTTARLLRLLAGRLENEANRLQEARRLASSG